MKDDKSIVQRLYYVSGEARMKGLKALWGYY